MAERQDARRRRRRSAVQRLLDESLAIEAEDARSAGALGVLARVLVQATLPHSKPATHDFERRNGYCQVVVRAASLGAGEY